MKSIVGSRITPPHRSQDVYEPSAWNPSYTWWLIIGWIFVFSIQTSTSGGFMGQRIYASKDEANASHSVLWFGFCYYVLNGWPWILTGVASLIILGPTNESAGLADYQEAYPQMIMRLAPIGMRGVMAAAMIAAFMSTISTLLNWGFSYIVNDFYSRFLVREASKRHYVWVSRLVSVCLAIFGGWFALQFETITGMLLSVSKYLTGGVIVMISRWLWHRTNIWSEISAMAGSIVVALFVDKGLAGHWHIWQSDDPFRYYGQQLVTIMVLSTLVWLVVTLLTKPVGDEQLKSFYRRVMPPGPGWRRIRDLCGPDCPPADSLGRIFITWLSGTIALFSLLAAIGYILACRWTPAAGLFIVSVIGTYGYFRLFQTLTHLEDKQ